MRNARSHVTILDCSFNGDNVMVEVSDVTVRVKRIEVTYKE
jgi:hypothetical protein